MKTFCFKLYKAKRNRKLHRQINAAGLIYNHCIALHKRYYRLYHKSLNVYALQKHLTKLKKIPRFSYLKEIGSQAVQDITQRIDRAYQLFFRNLKQKKTKFWQERVKASAMTSDSGSFSQRRTETTGKPRSFSRRM